MSDYQYMYDLDDGDSIKIDPVDMEITLYYRQGGSEVVATNHIDVRREACGTWFQKAIVAHSVCIDRWVRMNDFCQEYCEKAYARYLLEQIADDGTKRSGLR